ncbi:PQQ-dependent sugar dehydrogenase, partial [bacterium]|nr:PQQ-dependent sugar dehydrogenase [bacterium]
MNDVRFLRKIVIVSLTLILPTAIVSRLHAWQNPQPLSNDVSIKLLLAAKNNSTRLVFNPADDRLYFMTLSGDVYQADMVQAKSSLVFSSQDHGLSSTMGLTVSPSGRFYIVGNRNQGRSTIAAIKRGVLSNGNWSWSTVAETEAYPRAGNEFDHLFNGLAVSPDEEHLFVNSGSRTDHGEVQNNQGNFPNAREVALTSCILRLPTDGENIVLPNEEQALRDAGYFFADGLRNSFDLAFAPNGDLFATENSGDRDDNEELNWIREGYHYGFPWRMGTNDTPQQFPGYDPNDDSLANRASISWQRGFFHDDPTYPPPPEGVVFTDPIPNLGPDADQFRDEADGHIKNASAQGTSVGSFTPHRSPLGLVFDLEGAVGADMRGDAFMLSWNGAGDGLIAAFEDPGMDLLHLELTKDGDYQMSATRIVSGFANPIDAVMVGNRIYVLEWGGSRGIWEVTLPPAPVVQEYQPRINYNQLLEPVDKILHGAGQDPGKIGGPGQDAFPNYSTVMDEGEEPISYMYYESLFNIGTDWVKSLKQKLNPFIDRMIVIQFGLELVGATDAIA